MGVRGGVDGGSVSGSDGGKTPAEGACADSAEERIVGASLFVGSGRGALTVDCIE